jgi:hypothetical protein
MVCDGSALAQKLIEPLFGDGAGARRIHITAVIVSGRGSIYGFAEPDRLTA